MTCKSESDSDPSEAVIPLTFGIPQLDWSRTGGGTVFIQGLCSSCKSCSQILLLLVYVVLLISNRTERMRPHSLRLSSGRILTVYVTPPHARLCNCVTETPNRSTSSPPASVAQEAGLLAPGLRSLLASSTRELSSLLQTATRVLLGPSSGAPGPLARTCSPSPQSRPRLILRRLLSSLRSLMAKLKPSKYVPLPLPADRSRNNILRLNRLDIYHRLTTSHPTSRTGPWCP